MSTRNLVWGGLALVAFSLAGFGAWLLSLPSPSVAAQAPPVPEEEATATLASLRPPKHARPLVAVVGINKATETADYLVTTGILRRANIADVVMLATRPGPVRLYPALTVEADATIAEFDARHPDGADYVIVPGMSRDDDPVVLAWLQSQARKRAIIIGICTGAKVVGAAGLLDGKRATTHWYSITEMLKRNPSITYVPNRRMLLDRGVATTTGITASMPMMLTLIEAIAGRQKAESVGHDIGLPMWDARHASGTFQFTRPFAMTVLRNLLAFWNREEVGVYLKSGMGGVSPALVSDAWSRTYRSKAVTFAASGAAVETSEGMRVIPDRVAGASTTGNRISTFPDLKPAEALDHALDEVSARYGRNTTYVVTMQLEYPRILKTISR